MVLKLGPNQFTVNDLYRFNDHKNVISTTGVDFFSFQMLVRATGAHDVYFVFAEV